jgi:hypothetical protein
MKLFKGFLVAPATLGLLAPISATAKEVTISDFSYAEQIDISNNLENGLETRINNYEAGGFSETTTMSGSASFQIGAVNESAITEAVTATYSYDIDLNTTFTGEDNLYVGIETGNYSASSVDFALDSSGDGGDTLSVTSMYYQFPLGSYELAVGPTLDSDDLMPTTTSKYSDSFFFGSQYGLASNYFASQGTGAGVAVARTFDNGINTSGSVIATGGSSAAGILTKEGIDVLTLSLGYDADNYGGGIVYQKSESVCTLVGNHATQLCNDYGITTILDEGYNTTTFGAYYSPGEKTTFNVTSSVIDATVSGATVDTVADFQFAVDRKLGDGTLSASWKTFPFFKVPDLNGTLIRGDDLGSFIEIYYTYDVNDSFTITPGFAFAMPATDSTSIAAGSDDLAFYLYDRTAIGVGATFKF